MKYFVGTRKSKLALIQTGIVISQLKKKHPDNDYKIKTILTKGDVERRPIFMIDRKGIFEKEIDLAVANDEVDFAVHSLKDVPVDLHPDLIVSCIPKRAMKNDVFISKNQFTLTDVKKNAVVGTSSLRRAIQISRFRSDIVVKPIRGNIDSRLKKLDEGQFDGLVLAKASIDRLGCKEYFIDLDLTSFPSSPGQGALGIVCKRNNLKTIKMLKSIEDKNSKFEVDAERSLSFFLKSGCRFPIGAYASINNNSLRLSATAYSIDGKKAISATKIANKNDTNIIGKMVYESLYGQGIEKIANEWRQNYMYWCK